MRLVVEEAPARAPAAGGVIPVEQLTSRLRSQDAAVDPVPLLEQDGTVELAIRLSVPA